VRILVVGPPAAGKSTLARSLSIEIGAPVHHVDALRWKTPKQRRPADEVRARVADAVDAPAWVAEGSVGPTVNAFASVADAVVFLDYSRRVTLVRLIGRWAQRQRVGMPEGHRERPTMFAIRFNWRWRAVRRSALVRDIGASGKPLLHVTAPGLDLSSKVVAFARAQQAG
jgi:adenylate kinase family enzyme